MTFKTINQCIVSILLAMCLSACAGNSANGIPDVVIGEEVPTDSGATTTATSTPQTPTCDPNDPNDPDCVPDINVTVPPSSTSTDEDGEAITQTTEPADDDVAPDSSTNDGLPSTLSDWGFELKISPTGGMGITIDHDDDESDSDSGRSIEFSAELLSITPRSTMGESVFARSRNTTRQTADDLTHLSLDTTDVEFDPEHSRYHIALTSKDGHSIPEGAYIVNLRIVEYASNDSDQIIHETVLTSKQVMTVSKGSRIPDISNFAGLNAD